MSLPRVLIAAAPAPPLPLLLPLFPQLPLGLHDPVDGGAQAGVADVLLAHEVVVHPLLRVADDEEGAADVADLHRLLLLLHYEVVVPQDAGPDQVPQLLAFLANLLALVKLRLRLEVERAGIFVSTQHVRT